MRKNKIYSREGRRLRAAGRLEAGRLARPDGGRGGEPACVSALSEEGQAPLRPLGVTMN